LSPISKIKNVPVWVLRLRRFGSNLCCWAYSSWKIYIQSLFKRSSWWRLLSFSNISLALFWFRENVWSIELCHCIIIWRLMSTHCFLKFQIFFTAYYCLLTYNFAILKSWNVLAIVYYRRLFLVNWWAIIRKFSFFMKT
jgi:hypothetical protein